MFYLRSWIAREVFPIEPLAGCFGPMPRAMHGSPRYNLLQLHAPKRYKDRPGGLDVHPAPSVKVSEGQEWTVKSFFAAQDLSLLDSFYGRMKIHEVRGWCVATAGQRSTLTDPN
ncbi:uncharacterized protein FOMMEDRAFT_162736 [Fomitiporia mediterranea MF3/22]|uniref:Uncharacterized protein n=1 Tax=Fomitiporia mediterranea (strain MF3/22) TaxID=694068 RepID=R7SG77_FOMME|nr:uncharacterized protein FOMMEDRAFT_162736 [Fomitiporia mediterranea MF3/22]EJC97713.1 hypothetical protein FOMMEDRAFT_162736 [Fomitiporia mediterranea MF3/22]